MSPRTAGFSKRGWIVTGRGVRLGRLGRFRGSVALWGMVVVLIAAVAVGDGSVWAQNVEPTDTTVAAGAGSREQGFRRRFLSE